MGSYQTLFICWFRSGVALALGLLGVGKSGHTHLRWHGTHPLPGRGRADPLLACFWLCLVLLQGGG